MRLLVFLCVVSVVHAQSLDDAAHRQTVIANFAGSINSMATDATGNIYVAGTTNSPQFQVVNASQPQLAGGSDAFVAKLSPDGQVLWATFLGGSDNDGASGLGLDSAGNVYVTGGTYSSDFPSTVLRIGPTGKLFLARFDATGTLVSSVIFGGEGLDAGTGFDVNPKGSAVIVGFTTSTSFPTTPGVVHDRPDANDDNGFAIAFDSDGAVLFSTYLPGFSVVPHATAVNLIPGHREKLVATWESTGSVLVAGRGLGRLSPDGSTLGPTGIPSQRGVPNASIIGMATDAAGNLYLAGASYGLTVATCFRGFYSPSIRLYYLPTEITVAKFARDTRALVYERQMTGTCETSANTLSVGSDGSVAVTGVTLQGGFPLFNPTRQTPGGIVFQLDPDGVPTFSSYASMSGAVSAVDGSIYGVFSGSIVRTPVARTNTFTIGTARSAFNGDDRTVAPGMLLRIDGQQLADETIDMGLNNPNPLPKQLGGVQVLFDGTPASIFRVAPDHVMCVAPAAFPSAGSTDVQVIKGGENSTIFKMATSAQSIGLLTQSFPDLPVTQGKDADRILRFDGQSGVVRNEDGTLNSTTNRAPPGSTVTLFATGLGNPVIPGTNVALDLNPIIQPSTTPFPIRQFIRGTARPMDGFIAGLAAIDLQVPPQQFGPSAFTVRVAPSIVTIYTQ